MALKEAVGAMEALQQQVNTLSAEFKRMQAENIVLKEANDALKRSVQEIVTPRAEGKG